MRRSGCLREKVVLLSLVATAESQVTLEERLEVTPLLEVTSLACSLWHVIAYHGYMQDSNAPKILIEASKRMGCAVETNDTFFMLPREMIVEYAGTEMPIWQRKLFGALSRNMSYAPDYFFIPCTQIVSFNWMLKA
jgi:K+ transporter